MANTKKLTIEISPSLHAKIVRAARKEKTTITEIVRQTLYERVRKPKK